METKIPVSFANIFMVVVETKIINCSHFKPLTWKRYMDDVFSLWNITKEEIKLTAKISDREITFLDTCVYNERIKESILDVRTHFKPTETFQLIYKLHFLPPFRRQERPDQRRSLDL